MIITAAWDSAAAVGGRGRNPFVDAFLARCETLYTVDEAEAERFRRLFPFLVAEGADNLFPAAANGWLTSLPGRVLPNLYLGGAG